MKIVKGEIGWTLLKEIQIYYENLKKERERDNMMLMGTRKESIEVDLEECLGFDKDNKG